METSSWITAGKGPTLLAVGAVAVVWKFFSCTADKGYTRVSPLLAILFFTYETVILFFSTWKILSCIPDKDIRVFYLDRQFFSWTP